MLTCHHKPHVVVDGSLLFLADLNFKYAINLRHLELVEGVVEVDLRASLPRWCRRIPLSILFLTVTIG